MTAIEIAPEHDLERRRYWLSEKENGRVAARHAFAHDKTAPR
jgi:hypothetical protein